MDSRSGMHHGNKKVKRKMEERQVESVDFEEKSEGIVIIGKW